MSRDYLYRHHAELPFHHVAWAKCCVISARNGKMASHSKMRFLVWLTAMHLILLVAGTSAARKAMAHQNRKKIQFI